MGIWDSGSGFALSSFLSTVSKAALFTFMVLVAQRAEGQAVCYHRLAHP
jgi:hypothetical protein